MNKYFFSFVLVSFCAELVLAHSRESQLPVEGSAEVKSSPLCNAKALKSLGVLLSKYSYVNKSQGAIDLAQDDEGKYLVETAGLGRDASVEIQPIGKSPFLNFEFEGKIFQFRRNDGGVNVLFSLVNGSPQELCRAPNSDAKLCKCSVVFGKNTMPLSTKKVSSLVMCERSSDECNGGLKKPLFRKPMVSVQCGSSRSDKSLNFSYSSVQSTKCRKY